MTQYHWFMPHHVEAIYDHGVFRPIEPLTLPEGARVRLRVEEENEEGVPPAKKAATGSTRIRLPLVHTGRPGSVDLTGDRIAEILDDEDAAP